jgi:hypothetical protein
MGTPSRLSGMMAWQAEWEERSSFPPGPQLALCLHGATDERLAGLSDAELLEVAAAARRQTSWAQSRELAAIAELARRRTEDEERQQGPDGEPALDYRVLPAWEQVVDEIAAALRITKNAAAVQVHLAERLAKELPGTRRYLECGHIDLQRARVIVDLTDRLGAVVSAEVEGRVLDKAPEQTTGQLRRRLKKIVERLAPVEREERLKEAVTHRTLDLFENPEGTANLALQAIDPVCATGIFNKLNAVAHGMKSDGDTRRIHQIRADLATSLLQGGELAEAARVLLADVTETEPAPVTSVAAEPGDPVSGAIPSAAVASTSTGPRTTGERASTGRADRLGNDKPGMDAPPLPDEQPTGEKTSPEERELDAQAATVARIIERRLDQVTRHARDTGRLDHLHALVSRAVDDLSDHLATRHPCRIATGRSGTWDGAEGQDGDAPDRTHGYPGYRPPPALRELIEKRHARCVYPSCSQPAHRCDVDHTVPWRPGVTCHCNLGTLCRRHHRLKQSSGWKLVQPWPGVLVWVTPSGKWYITLPDRN